MRTENTVMSSDVHACMSYIVHHLLNADMCPPAMSGV